MELLCIFAALAVLFLFCAFLTLKCNLHAALAPLTALGIAVASHAVNVGSIPARVTKKHSSLCWSVFSCIPCEESNQTVRRCFCAR